MGGIAEAVVLAAGLGRRLRAYLGTVKYLAEIGGEPLISYPLRALKAVGVRSVHLVVNPSHAEELVGVARRIFNRVDYVLNPHPERENGYSLLLAEDLVEDDYFYVSMADHIYQPGVLEVLAREAVDSVAVLGGDRSPRFIDVAEATKILAPEGLVMRIGKGLEEYTHIDVGVHVFSRKIYEVVRRGHIPERLSLSTLVNTAVAQGLVVKVADVTGFAWTEIDTPRDYEEVLHGYRRTVLEALRLGGRGAL